MATDPGIITPSPSTAPIIDYPSDDFGPTAYTFNVRGDSNLDVLLVTLTFGIVIILWLFYLVYLGVRWSRRRIPGYRPSKADRPSWVILLIISGSFWLLSTLLWSGIAYIDPLPSWLTCSLIKFMGQYTLGWTLWTAAVTYKLIRKFTQLRMVKKKPPHAALTIFLQWFPFLMLALGLGWWLEGEQGIEDYQCYLMNPSWLITLYGLTIILLLVFIFCFVKIRRTIGAHHQIIRYGIFLATSFSFPLIDAMVQFIPTWHASIIAERCILILVMMLVIGNLLHVAVLVFKRRQKLGSHTMGLFTRGEGTLRRSDEMAEGASVESLSVSDLGSTPAPPQAKASEDATLDEINVMMSEGRLERSSPVAGNGVTIMGTVLPETILTRPRRKRYQENDASADGGTSGSNVGSNGGNDSTQPDFDRYVDTLNEEQQAELDRGRGYWLTKSRPFRLEDIGELPSIK